MKTKDVLIVMLAPVPLLLVPLVAMQFSKEWNWDGADFIFAWVLMASAGLAYKAATKWKNSLTYRAAAGLAITTGFILTWINLAVGLIGSEGNPANLMYVGVLAVGIVGAIIARFQARGMARALFAAALAQFLIPVIALIIWRSDFSPGVVPVFGLNAFFVMLFSGSAMLFLRAAQTQAMPS